MRRKEVQGREGRRGPGGRAMSVKRILTPLLTLGFLCVVFPAGAWAVEAKPFEITKFSMQTIASTTVSGPIVSDEAGGTATKCEPCHVENIPYTPAFTQAGGHPWAITTTGAFATETLNNKEKTVEPTRDPKDIVVNLPAGLLGDPLAVPECPLAQVTHLGSTPCPGSTQIGMFRLRLFGDQASNYGPIVNVAPEPGQSAEIGLEIERGNRSFGGGTGTSTVNLNTTILLTAHLVHTEQGYGFTVITNSITPFGNLVEYELTVWGVPADPSHDPVRGLYCYPPGSESSAFLCEGGGESAGVAPVPFWSLPTDCSVGPEVTTMRADSWEEPGSVVEGRYSEQFKAASSTMPGVTGCNLLKFEPGLKVQSDSLMADEPVGVGVGIEVPQPEKPEVDATPHLRDAVVTFPEGMSISPGIVDGIQACNETGPEGINISGPESEEVGLSGELQLAPGHCPDASTVGTAEAITPLLSTPVKGHVYLARPGCGGPGQAPCTDQDALDGNLYKLYLELGGTGENAQDGIQIKVPLKTEANPATGQLTTVTEENPQTPFSELRIHLDGGARAPLDNPAVCGPAVSTADLTPWSEPGITPEGVSLPGTPDAALSSFFDVEGCAAGGPSLNPGFVAGTVTPQAGQFSAFTLNFSREDREQFVKGIQVHTPPGLLGMLSSVQLCEEPEANDGHCPEASRIGTTRVASGAGSHPFEIEGTVYLTGPHDGAPFGLSVVTPAVAGPFNLGLVVVRARIDVNPENSTLTVTTDETGPYALPQILDGVPLRLKRITVNIDRPDFMFNPTDCGAPGQPGTQEVTAVLSGSGNAKTSVASQFAVGGCKSLEFKPKFAVSTSGKTSKAGGASLDAKLSYPAGSVGSEANIARVKVDLPKQLPSRLTTLQKACLAAVFEANPANCPVASVVGIVKANTPLLPVELTGPVYFVSHGGEAFPSLIVVLQGNGVRVDLTGSTFISKAGITSSTFKTVPDVPVNTFEIYLPEGKYSALAANGNLCTSKLAMPTAFVAQNGAEIHETTKISVTGCPKAKKAKKKKPKNKKKVAKSRRGGKK